MTIMAMPMSRKLQIITNCRCGISFWLNWITIIYFLSIAFGGVCNAVNFERNSETIPISVSDDSTDGSSASSSSPIYVDPSDMGSYSHSLQRNVKLGNFNKLEAYYSNDHIQSTDETDDVEYKLKNSYHIQNLNIKSAPCVCESVCRESPAIMIYTKRIIASILRQLNVWNHKFGPKEAITIDLQAELSFEDFNKLNNFISNKTNYKDGIIADINLTTHLAAVTDIIGNLFHVIYPNPTLSFTEYIKENLNFHFFYSIKFWIYMLSGMTIVFVVGLFLQKIYLSTHPIRSLFYCFVFFYVVSCIVVFHDLYQTAKSENRARLYQYNKLPKDCNYNEFGFFESIGYYVRVKVLKQKDQCHDYYKQLAGDDFFHVAPVEAISETFSRLVFHPMEYIGDKVGKFIGGIISEVPFWLKPILLTLIVLFGFLAVFRYRITTPFLSIEPLPLPSITQRYLEAPTDNRCEQQAIIERPPMGEIVRTSAGIDVSTSTDDLEDYINTSRDYNSNQRTNSPWTLVIQNYIWIFITFILYYLNILLRRVPQEDEFVRNEDDDMLFENFFQDAQE